MSTTSLRHRVTPSPRHLAAYILLATTALYTQYYAIFLPIGLTIYAVWRWRRNLRALLLWLGAQVIVALLYLPWVLYAAAEAGAVHQPEDRGGCRSAAWPASVLCATPVRFPGRSSGRAVGMLGGRSLSPALDVVDRLDFVCEVACAGGGVWAYGSHGVSESKPHPHAHAPTRPHPRTASRHRPRHRAHPRLADLLAGAVFPGTRERLLILGLPPLILLVAPRAGCTLDTLARSRFHRTRPVDRDFSRQPGRVLRRPALF